MLMHWHPFRLGHQSSFWNAVVPLAVGLAGCVDPAPVEDVGPEELRSATPTGVEEPAAIQIEPAGKEWKPYDCRTGREARWDGTAPDALLVANLETILACRHLGWFLRRASRLALTAVLIPEADDAGLDRACGFLERERVLREVLLLVPGDPQPEVPPGVGPIWYLQRSSTEDAVVSEEGPTTQNEWRQLQAWDGLELWRAVAR